MLLDLCITESLSNQGVTVKLLSLGNVQQILGSAALKFNISQNAFMSSSKEVRPK